MSSRTPSTRQRILNGALQAIAEHGLADLTMRDVAAASGVARGTLYRHFANREELVLELSQREAARYLESWRVRLAGIPAGEDRLGEAIEYPARLIREHPVVQKLVESDPAYVLHLIREHYAAARETLQRLLGPIVGESDLVRQGVVSAEYLVDWFVRIVLSMLLFPSEDPAAMARGTSAIHRALRAGEAA